MRLVITIVIVGSAGWSASLAPAGDKADPRDDIRVVAKQGRGTAAGRAAWERISSGGSELIVPILEAMDTPDTVAANWLRTALDRIVERDGKNLDVDRLLDFVKDADRQGRARRLALDLVEQRRPGTSVKLYAGWLEDPEFRVDAVDLTLDKAGRLLKTGDKQAAAAAFHQAFEASRDQTQCRKAAAGLLDLGTKVSVGKHMGFLADWYLIGPFDAGGMKGFHLSYPPEKQIDLKAEYQGQGKKVRWLRYQAQEPPPGSGARHQSLINIRERDAIGDADDAVAFAYTEFTVPKAQEVEFRGAADDNFTVWVNGRRAFGFEEYRNGVRLDRHRFKARLSAGKNTVLVKVCQTPAPNTEPNWEFLLRIVDATEKGVTMECTLPKK